MNVGFPTDIGLQAAGVGDKVVLVTWSPVARSDIELPAGECLYFVQDGPDADRVTRTAAEIESAPGNLSD